MVKILTNANIAVGKQPVVVLPLADYERLQEDLEMLRSKLLPKKIAEARQQKQRGETLSVLDLKKSLQTLHK